MEKRRVLVVGSGCEKIVGFLREKGFDARGVSRAAETAGAAEAAILLPSVGEAEARTIAETFPKAFIVTVGPNKLEGALHFEVPLAPAAFLQSFSSALELHERMRALEGENDRLKAALDDMKIIDRAKCALVRYQNMTEQEAHRYLEKTAMDRRLPRRVIAAEILKTYEN